MLSSRSCARSPETACGRIQGEITHKALPRKRRGRHNHEHDDLRPDPVRGMSGRLRYRPAMHYCWVG
jgi:hypothetical protein